MSAAPARFRFGDFVLSPRQRLLLRNGAPVALIPKYFDLLHLLIRRRRDAVSKQTIFTEIWVDVVVTDGALSQAVRTLRRALDDDPREPRFIRTVSRHGYQFVWPDVCEEADDGTAGTGARPAPRAEPEGVDRLVTRLMAAAAEGIDDEARDLAERAHVLGTADAMARLTAHPGHARAVAIMREARWSVPGAGRVPLVTDPEAVPTILAVVRLRLSDVGRTVAKRWAAAASAGALGGALAGLLGGLALLVAPGSTARPESALALAALGALAGGIGAAGIGGGLAAAEVLARSRRGLALALCGAGAGAVVAGAGHLLLRALLEGFGLPHPYVGGALDGLVLGGVAGAAYGRATLQPPGGGLAAPAGRRRIAAALLVGAACALTAAILALSGRSLVGGMVHEIARSSRDAKLVLAPLGHLIGEPGFGTLTRTLLSAFEGGIFGVSLAFGLTRRPS